MPIDSPPPAFRFSPRRSLWWGAALYGTFLGVLGLWSVVAGCRRQPPTAVATAPHPATRSADCRSCHEEIYQQWAASHHALAHRPVDAAADADAFGAENALSLHGVDYTVAWEGDRPRMTEKAGDRPNAQFHPDFVLGYTPLRQYVVPTENGRYQVPELTFDPAKKEWFNVFGDERRTHGEWGHWLGRGMNWNSMCAHCHLTDYRKNYNPVSDTYTSTWREHGVGCVQCHGDIAADHGTKPGSLLAPVDRVRAQETCAPCHARNELLTGDVRPGVPYSDHYRLSLPTDPAVFYPDGQVLGENFNYTSLLTSRMGGKAGVTCLDCHEPHSGRTKLPVQNNALCLQCHGAPGPQNAPVIDPMAHSRHAADSVGNRCVSCHMTTTTYMQRDPRHDHGFIKPDPLLTKELGIPNACNGCHTDQTVDWAIARTDEWYGAKMNSRQRERTRVVAGAQANAPGSAGRLHDMITSEDIPAWKATLLLLARPYVGTDARLAELARQAVKDPDPLVRSAAAQVLGETPGAEDTLRPLLNDSTRLVRLDAAWALSRELGADSPARRELDAYLAVSADQPAGRLRIGQDLFNRGRHTEAVAAVRKAVEWDPNSAGIYDVLGHMLDAVGQSNEAAGALWRSAQLNPTEPSAAFNAALAFAAAGKLADAELALREALRRDPRYHRAWYNLGLLLSQTGRAPEAVSALEQAETLAPNVADYPYARATILWQRGDREGTAAAVRRTLAINPAHPQAQELLRRLGN